MKRSALILFIDVISFIGFIFLTSTGIILHYTLPPGSGRWSDIWGFNRHEWGDIHFIIAVVFFCTLALHLIIHWRVIVNMIQGRKSEASFVRLGLGLTGLLAILIFAFAPVASSTNTIDKPDGKGWRNSSTLK
jgi:hypothetical protein